MKKLAVAVWLLSQAMLMSCSQVSTDTAAISAANETNAEAQGLSLKLELADNHYQNKAQSRSVLTITNNGTETLPAKGWKLYFNGGALTAADSTVATIQHFNGDLHYLAPGPKFEEIAPGASGTIEVLGRTVRNVSNFPSGFYIVYDAEPGKGIPVSLEIEPGNHFDEATQQLAAKIYEDNATIKDLPTTALTKVFPTPISYQEKGKPFTLDTKVTVVADADFRREAEHLSEILATAVGQKPAIQSSATGKAIYIRKKPGMGAEEYTLSVNPERIEITASSPAGAFYGIQSLKTMLPATAYAGKAATVEVAGVEVKDAPRFGYRGFMMDMARNFQPKSEVLKVLDVMALYKMNKLHFHFSEDEGWRLEIRSLPELTAVGGTRAHATDGRSSIVPSYGSGPDASNKAGTGFYSREDFIEILKYARDRHIEVIPEIETPGHARAAIKAMDARYMKLMDEGKKEEAERYLLRDLNDKSVYRSVQGWSDNIMDVSLPSTYNFLETVVDEIMSMYKEAEAPLHTIHFGGDEVPEGVWEKSPSVQRLISQNPEVKNTDDLWYYYFGKVNQMLQERGLYLSGWEEIGLRKEVKNGKVNWVPNQQFANENFHVNVWKNSPGSGAEDLAYRMANAGYKVILTGVTHFYLDLAYNPSFSEPGLYWGGYVDIDKPFYFIPYDYLRNLKEDDRGNPLDRSIIKSKEALTEKGKANIVGIEAPLWSETNRTTEDFEYKLLPKLLGVAERAWAKDPDWAKEKDAAKSNKLYSQAWSEFINVVGKRELPRLDYYAGGYQYRIPTAGAKVIDGKVVANVQFPGFTIRYTTDGTEPTKTSPAYSGPIAATGAVKLRVFNTAGRGGQTITIQNQSSM
ncbi:family 20 glycosylhydrolase [Pontibacter korlensis]|uniref:beta-N-acetylhexosaminidase n=1 Tax=Pontibacter korlensis TaxID=400092 RepID=A0A0E3ZDM3_9BACT|nr:family 20 glycosylhydrolase [Pontibacter korlensis]AKD02374.1 beta-N-acetylhexosaminidase [Pontibacter korlensis]